MRFKVQKTDLKGMGIYAKKSIFAFDVISNIQYVREVTSDTPISESEKHLQDHIHYWPDGRMFIVDEPSTYFNHSCQPNAYICSAAKEYFIIAKEDINAGDEITVDYEIHTTGGDSSWECKCGARNCRGLHKWDFFLLPRKVILGSLPFLDPWFAQIHGERIREILKQELKV